MDKELNGKLIELTNIQSEALLNTPESGMGFQVISEIENSKVTSKTVVGNSKYIFTEGYKLNFEHPIIKNLENFEFSPADIPNKEFITSLGKSLIITQNTKFTAKSNDKFPEFAYLTKSGDEFRRLSAFKDDKRISENGSLQAGSYATSVSDLTVVPSGVAAVGRYALPNRFAACYIYQIIPPPGTLVYFGTVKPNYGLCGGGVEIYFPNGCGAKSVRLIGTLSEI